MQVQHDEYDKQSGPKKRAKNICPYLTRLPTTPINLYFI